MENLPFTFDFNLLIFNELCYRKSRNETTKL